MSGHFLRNEYGEGGSAECESMMDLDEFDDAEVQCGAEPTYRCWGCDCWICEKHTNFVGQDSPRAKFCGPCLVRFGDEYIPRQKRLEVRPVSMLLGNR
jgi:hypothetical protein